ncbi:MAG: F0F1 ATP synthase subunit epsilon [Fulvimarina sp.]|nr:F0F1 ATP synthase subunit epsilon [Fulvimarina sp.]
MHLRILLPFKVFADTDHVLRLVAATSDGLVGFLPQRLDCAARLVPGILEYEITNDGIAYVALDGGVLIKTGPDIVISVRRAIAGTDLETLHHQIDDEFLTLSEAETSARSVMAKLEGGFLRRFASLDHE